MDRAYFHLIEKTMDCATMAQHIAKNANYKPSIDKSTSGRLQKLIEASENLRRELQDVLSEQMRSY